MCIRDSSKTLIFPGENEDIPPFRYTPNFDMSEYFRHLNPQNTLGSLLLYGEVVTSTSTVLNSNRSLLDSVPENTLLPVSYTHLDVYKRQPRFWLPWQ